MRAKFLLLAVLIAAVFAVGFYVGNSRQEPQAVPEKIVEYTIQMTAEEAKILTEQQEKDFQEAGFRTDSFHSIETRVKGGAK